MSVPFGGCGVVFKLSPSGSGWTEDVMLSFTGVNGALPTGGLTADNSGNFYGVTQFGGDLSAFRYGFGTIFLLSPSGSGVTQTLLYAFPNGSTNVDSLAGAYPSHLTVDGAGNLFGTTEFAGANACTTKYNCGSVFELSPNGGGGWNFATVYSFNNADGEASPNLPTTGVLPDGLGNLFGVTATGGRSGACAFCGTAYEITP